MPSSLWSCGCGLAISSGSGRAALSPGRGQNSQLCCGPSGSVGVAFLSPSPPLTWTPAPTPPVSPQLTPGHGALGLVLRPRAPKPWAQPSPSTISRAAVLSRVCLLSVLTNVTPCMARASAVPPPTFWVQGELLPAPSLGLGPVPIARGSWPMPPSGARPQPQAPVCRCPPDK